MKINEKNACHYWECERRVTILQLQVWTQRVGQISMLYLWRFHQNGSTHYELEFKLNLSCQTKQKLNLAVVSKWEPSTTCNKPLGFVDFDAAPGLNTTSGPHAIEMFWSIKSGLFIKWFLHKVKMVQIIFSFFIRTCAAVLKVSTMVAFASLLRSTCIVGSFTIAVAPTVVSWAARVGLSARSFNVPGLFSSSKTLSAVGVSTYSKSKFKKKRIRKASLQGRTKSERSLFHYIDVPVQ